MGNSRHRSGRCDEQSSPAPSTGSHFSLQSWTTEVLPIGATAVSFFAGSLFVGNAFAAVLVPGPADSARYAALYALYASLGIPLGLAAGRQWRRWHRLPDKSA